MTSSETKHQSGHSDVVTHDVRVQAASQFLPERSAPEKLQYVFVYRVRISNEGDEPATLRSRRWVITDADGEIEIVEGPGVVGEEPRLESGASHEYMSGCPLETSWGTMEGHFVMEREDGSTFEAQVGRFFLAPTVDPISSQN
jgi:ApaG protein